MFNKILVSCVSRDANGNVDLAASKAKYESILIAANVAKLSELDEKLAIATGEVLSKFDDDVNDYLKHRAAWDTLSADAVTYVFTTHATANKNGNVLKNTLVSMSAGHLLSEQKITLSDFKLAEVMIASYIDDNVGTLFTVHKGAGGGVGRIQA